MSPIISTAKSVVASEVKQVVAHPHVPRRINDLKIAMVLVSWWHDHVQTCFEDVYCCRRRTRCWFRPKHTASGVNGISILNTKIRYRDDREYADHFPDVAAPKPGRSPARQRAGRRIAEWRHRLCHAGRSGSTTTAAQPPEDIQLRLRSLSIVRRTRVHSASRRPIRSDATFCPATICGRFQTARRGRFTAIFPRKTPTCACRKPSCKRHKLRASIYCSTDIMRTCCSSEDAIGQPACCLIRANGPIWWATSGVGHQRQCCAKTCGKRCAPVVPPSWQRRWRGRYSPLRQVAHQHVSTDLIRRTGLEETLDLYADRPAFSTTQALTRYNHSS